MKHFELLCVYFHSSNFVVGSATVGKYKFNALLWAHPYSLSLCITQVINLRHTPTIRGVTGLLVTKKKVLLNKQKSVAVWLKKRENVSFSASERVCILTQMIHQAEHISESVYSLTR